MSKCVKCGELLKPYEKFCGNCGTPVTNNKKRKTSEFSKQSTGYLDADLPNTKDGIYDFFISAAASFKYERASRDASMVKMEKAYNKAKILLSEDSPEMTEIENIYWDSKDYVSKMRIGASIVFIEMMILGFLFFFFVQGDSGSLYYMIFGDYGVYPGGDKAATYWTFSIIGAGLFIFGISLLVKQSLKK